MRSSIATLVFVLALLFCAGASAQPPNVVFILVDDLRWDELGAAGNDIVQSPNIDRLAREGALFQNAFVTTPLCSPSRASFLTGQYARNHGIIDNTNRSAASHRLATFPMYLQRAGYETAFIGKWHMGNDDAPRPGFDTWVSFKGQGQYLDPEISENGRTATVRGYITDIRNARAVEFVQRPRSNPFLLYLSHKAVHPNIRQLDDGSVVPIDGEMFVPPDRHRQLLAGVTVSRRPNYGTPPLDKPALMRRIGDLPPLGPGTVTDDATVLGRQRALAAVDDGVGDIREALEEQGQLADTVIFLPVTTATSMVSTASVRSGGWPMRSRPASRWSQDFRRSSLQGAGPRNSYSAWTLRRRSSNWPKCRNLPAWKAARCFLSFRLRRRRGEARS
ncbi:MAG: sulfatase-like hydrolase/transferase [Woeseiaceae bacterium]|nr:sulfatase-like hydrolase/transferase [Woeseiaceae bacterium]